MSVDASPDFDSMNETDVREIIVRPLLERLGYKHGTDANIRTERTLRYDRAFLGRKSPLKDPPLQGRADYICDAVSYGRWVIEVKAPGERLTEEVAQQAHTYAAHPEIGASHFMVTNGRTFEVFQTGRLEAPVLSFPHEDLEQRLLPLFNLVGPEAIKKRAKLSAADPGKPLGRGIASQTEIIGGEVTYDNHESDSPLVNGDYINGLALPITGGFVRRDADGRIHAHVEIANAAPIFREGGKTGGADDYEFFCADEYISIDPASPTIFQNIYEKHTAAGSPMTIPGLGPAPMPFSLDMVAYTDAVGFVAGDVFQGRMHLSYDMAVSGLTPQLRAALEAHFGAPIPARSRFAGGGTFRVKMRDAI